MLLLRLDQCSVLLSINCLGVCSQCYCCWQLCGICFEYSGSSKLQ